MKYTSPVEIFTVTELDIALAAGALVEFTGCAGMSEFADRMSDRIGVGGWVHIIDEADIAGVRNILTEDPRIGDLVRAHFPA